MIKPMTEDEIAARAAAINKRVVERLAALAPNGVPAPREFDVPETWRRVARQRREDFKREG